MFDLRFEPTHEAAARAREAATRLLEAADLAPRLIADLELVIAELLANAVEQVPTEPIRLQAKTAEGAIILTVANQYDCSPCDSSRWDPVVTDASLIGEDPDSISERGRGLAIVEALVDEIWVDREAEWTFVRCRCLVGRDPADETIQDQSVSAIDPDGRDGRDGDVIR